MPNRFSKTSAERLATCDPRLQEVMTAALELMDITIIEGHRTVEAQRAHVAAGRSKTMTSKHLTSPSLAVDVAPYPVDWNDRERFHYLAGMVRGLAAANGITIRWGGDWDLDGEVLDNAFDDLPHFEIRD